MFRVRAITGLDQTSRRRQREQDVGISSAIETEHPVQIQVGCAYVEPERVNPEQSSR
jgi:hypothetical protein